VVDDSATTRGFLADELRDAGVVCDVAPDAPAALARLRAAAAAATPHDVALVDLDMPSTSGAELAEAIAADRALGTVQVVLLVPVGRREQAEAALAAHVAAVLTKPVRPSRLHEALAALAEPPPAAAFSAGS
jgi:CheY-like chemotaxis protein